jgi:hypothetical protein
VIKVLIQASVVIINFEGHGTAGMGKPHATFSHSSWDGNDGSLDDGEDSNFGYNHSVKFFSDAEVLLVQDDLAL